MIFKVCSYNVDSVGSWVFIADVVELSTGRLFLRKSETGKENLHHLGLFVKARPLELAEAAGENKSDPLIVVDSVFLPRRPYDAMLTGKQKQTFLKVSVVYLKFRDGTHRSVVFWEAYLLNDEGKTIERM